MSGIREFGVGSDLEQITGGAGVRRHLGLDLGAETIKAVELTVGAGGPRVTRREVVEHGKSPGRCLLDLLARWDWAGIHSAAVTGRLSRVVQLPRVPTQHAQARGYRFHFGARPATLISIGSHGFSVLELRPNGTVVFRENSRCSQGTGNFLRQLVERFSLGIAEASELCADVENPAPLSGRCPVILKTDMTHLANKGEGRAQILAGLFDAVCANVLVLVRPGVSPEHVCLLGGVSRSRRIQRTFAQALAGSGMTLTPLAPKDALFFEATGAALEAVDHPARMPALAELLTPPIATRLDRVDALHTALTRVRRLPVPPTPGRNGHARELILGFDIGSTGSKLVALDVESCQSVWEGYRRTLGDPVGAAQALLTQFVGANAAGDRIVAAGATGSGREIAGSLLATCYGPEAVFVLNEIAAHAEGARHFDPRVDTIFEIGGQDAKYIRLAEGRVVDCAMNEACSAGTGSFIEEQGRKFTQVQNVAQLGELALTAPSGVSLGQHCSVFMAEIIEEAVAAGVAQNEIVAGLYDSIIQNYLHRVKGNRSVGKVIFCQGMPFASDALAAAVARQTGSEVIIPPNPGTVGALGIALLAHRELPGHHRAPLDPARFLEARIEAKETFICHATRGCGGGGNKCRIDRLRTVVAGRQQQFTWGGGCALHDRGTRKRKLPDRAPDPFREREEIQRQLLARPVRNSHGRRVALADEFMLKGLFPFFVVFFQELGFEVMAPGEADHPALQRGIREANVPFCAPMQLFHGLAAQLAETPCDHLFVPMLRSTPRVNGESDATVCPVAQGCGDVLKWDLPGPVRQRLLSPVMDMGPGNLDSAEFRGSCARLAATLQLGGRDWQAAHRAAVLAQQQFDTASAALGQRALDFCREHDLVPVVVLGRPYTIYNRVLNSNVPALLREQGAVAIPLDCYPVPATDPVLADIYWGYSQRILRAARAVRQTPGVYSVFCSNYACGPDSFSLHFYAHLMAGKPFAIIETDGHAGDAGTKTRLEAFLHCVQQDRATRANGCRPNDLRPLQLAPVTLRDAAPDELLLVPYIGPPSEIMTAALQGLGYAAEMLPAPDAESLRLGRRYTSGKECVPMGMTLGTLLRRLEAERDARRRFMLVMPHTRGPCRFGMYNLLNQLTLERLGWRERVRIWSPSDRGYFADTPPGFTAALFTGFLAADALLEALLTTRPDELQPGAAAAVYERYHAELLALVAGLAGKKSGFPDLLWEITAGGMFGVQSLLQRAAREFAALRQPRERPTLLLVGEIYVRSVPFANDFVIAKLEARGCRVRFAPCGEWLEYADTITLPTTGAPRWADRVSSWLQARIQERVYRCLAPALAWPKRTTVADSLAASEPYLRRALLGEAVLTIGAPLHEWQAGEIDGVVSVGPLECMPNKLAEAQFFHVREQTGLPSLTLPLIGDPLNLETLDNFVFEVQSQFRRRAATCPGAAAA
jgi:predicted CoA-substrate-specific enzyme activase